MSREIRVRLRKDIAVCDGQTSTVVFAGTEGTALSVNSPEDRLRDKPRTIAVSWDAALLNERTIPPVSPPAGRRRRSRLKTSSTSG
jgi:hypothetical protein